MFGKNKSFLILNAKDAVCIEVKLGADIGHNYVLLLRIRAYD